MISEKNCPNRLSHKKQARRRLASENPTGFPHAKKAHAAPIRLLVPASQTHNVHRQVFWLGSNAPADLPGFPVTSPAFAPLTAAGQHRPFTCFPFP